MSLSRWEVSCRGYLFSFFEGWWTRRWVASYEQLWNSALRNSCSFRGRMTWKWCYLLISSSACPWEQCTQIRRISPLAPAASTDDPSHNSLRSQRAKYLLFRIFFPPIKVIVSLWPKVNYLYKVFLNDVIE